MKVFKIALHKGQYSVSIPDYPGGDVVEYETAKALETELALAKWKISKLRERIQTDIFSMKKTLNETQ